MTILPLKISNWRN